MCVCFCVCVCVCVCVYVYICMYVCICCPTSSSLLQRILVEAHRSGTKFRVVVVDGRPWREGREMLRRLVGCGLDCSYILVSAASFIMREVCNVNCQEQWYICNQHMTCSVSLIMLCYFNYWTFMLQIYWCSYYLICTIFRTSVTGPNTAFHILFFFLLLLK